MHNINDEIEIIKNHLNENGKILIAVPNIDSVDAKYLKMTGLRMMHQDIYIILIITIKIF